MISARLVLNCGLCGSAKARLTSTATTMPAPAQTMPPRAVTGEDMRFRPKMNRNAAAKYDAWTTRLIIAGSLFLGPGFLNRLGRLEHAEHALGHDVAASHIAGAEQHGGESQRLFQH